jgi:hypothetical protein
MLAFLCRHAHFLTIGNSDATRKQSHDEKSLERSAYRPYPEDRHRADDFSASRDRKPPPAIPKQRINGLSPSGVVWAAAMVWIYWDTFWSLFFRAIWLMTIVSHPDAQIHRQVAPMPM